MGNNAVPTTILNQTLVNTGFNIEWATYQVVPTSNGCVGSLTNYVVTVFPVADVVFMPNGQTFCSGLTSAIGLGSNVAGATFTWTASGSGPSLSGYGPGSGNLIQQTLFNTGPFPEWTTYQVAPTANGCPGTAGSVIVTVSPFPVMSFTPCFDAVVSVNAQPVILKGAIPLGGTYSGPGVAANIFYPAIAGPGSHVLNYTYINTWTCAGNAGSTINVVALAPFACGNNILDVRDNQSYPTVQIGGQCWFSANLNYGNTIPSAQMQRDNCIFEKYCFSDVPANCALTGGMYQWDEMMNYIPSTGCRVSVPRNGMFPPRRTGTRCSVFTSATALPEAP